MKLRTYDSMEKRKHPASKAGACCGKCHRVSEPRYGYSFNVYIEHIDFSVLFTNLVNPLRLKLQIPSRAGIET